MSLINTTFFKSKKKRPIAVELDTHPNQASLFNLLSLGQSSRKSEEIKAEIAAFTFSTSSLESELEWLSFYLKVEKHLLITDGKYIGTAQVLRNHLCGISENFSASAAFNALIGNQESQQVSITKYFIKYFLHHLKKHADTDSKLKSWEYSEILNSETPENLDKVSFLFTQSKLKEKFAEITSGVHADVPVDKIDEIFSKTIATFSIKLKGIEQLLYLNDLQVKRTSNSTPTILNEPSASTPVIDLRENNIAEQPPHLKNYINYSRSILDNILDSYLLTDKAGRIIDFNSNAKKLFGYPDHVLKQMKISDLLPQSFNTKLQNDLNPNDFTHFFTVLGKRNEIEIKTESAVKDMEITVTNNYTSPEDTYTILLKDLSQKKETIRTAKEAKVHAERSAQAKSTFLSNMSHEIRTPLNVILGLSDIINSDPNITQETIKENLQGIDFSARNLLSIVNDILDFSKIEAGKLSVQSLDFNLKKIITGTCSGFKIKAQEKGLEYVSQVNNNIPDIVIGDQYRLNQVLTNLIGNAIKFTNEGRVSLHIKTVNETDENVTIEFRVIDTGIGIDDKQLKNIFNSFYQIEKPENSIIQGTGLGLAITKQLIELLGGTLRAQSTNGKGSTFAFDLPFKKSALKSLDVQQSELDKKDEQLAGLKILVAEDNKMNQFYIKQLLKNLNITTVIAENGQEALDLYLDETHTFDLILMDMHMPVMNGIESIKLIRNSSKNRINKVPIVICSADVFPETRKNAVKAGIDFYLTKPLSLEALKEVLFWLVNDNFSVIKNPENQIDPQSKNIDIEHLTKTFDNDLDFIAGLLEVFIKETPEDYNSLRDCISRGYYPRVKEIAHKLKSSFMNLGMTVHGHHLQQIEKNILFSEHQKVAIEHFEQFNKLYSKTLLEANLLILDMKRKQTISA